MGELGLEHIAAETSIEEDQLLHGILEDFFGNTLCLASISVDPPYSDDPSNLLDTYATIVGWINIKHQIITNLFESLKDRKYQVLRVIKNVGCNYAHVILIPIPNSDK